MMHGRRLDVRVVLAGMMLASAGIVAGQSYPDKPIRLITAPPGGPSDLVARVVAHGLSLNLGQPVIVDNRGAVAIEIAAKTPADGYSLLFIGSALWLLPLMRERVSYDPFRDFLPISMTARSPTVLAVYPAVPANSVSEL